MLRRVSPSEVCGGAMGLSPWGLHFHRRVEEDAEERILFLLSGTSQDKQKVSIPLGAISPASEGPASQEDAMENRHL
jgi:hypothetical protein